MPHHTKVFPVAPTDGATALTSAEVVALDNGQFTAIDGDAGGTWSPAALIEIAGAGLQIDKGFKSARQIALTGGAPTYAFDASGPDYVVEVVSVAGGTLSPAIVLPQVVLNREITICDNGSVFAGAPVSLTPHNSSDTIDGAPASVGGVPALVMQTNGGSITLLGVATDSGAGGAWKIVARKTGRVTVTITTVGTNASVWRAPPGVTFADLEMCGGGGSGSGGVTGNNTAGNRYGGGPGGGAAPRLAIRVSVVPGTAYDVTVGDGGASVAAGATGNDGNPSSFNPHGGAILAWAPGGGGGQQPAPASGALAIGLGGTIAQAAAIRPATPTFQSTVAIAPLGAGGFGTNGDGSDGLSSTVGSTGVQGTSPSGANNGGAAGTPGALSGTYHGGGAGGGGGGGPFGTGGNGGNGGNGNNSGAGNPGTAGSAAPVNSGAGGGGGGAGGSGSSAGGLGQPSGKGGSGQVIIAYDSP